MRHTLFLLLLLLLLVSSSLGGGTTSSRGSGGSGGSSTTGADVGQHLLDILALESLGEDLGPDGLDLRDVGGLDQSVELVGLLSNKTRKKFTSQPRQIN